VTSWIIVVPTVSGALGVKALRSFETSGTTASATLRHIPEDGSLLYHECDGRSQVRRC
jgi:hypothetical protein